MNPSIKRFAPLFAALLAVGALMLIGPAFSVAEEGEGEEVTFSFPQHTQAKNGTFEVVQLSCENSCNHVFFTVKHGNKLVAKGTTWPHANYTPEIDGKLKPFARKQLRRHGKLQAYAHVCVHPPGPENYCQGAKILIK